MIIFENEYDGESIVDMEEHVYDAVNEADVPVDEHGFAKGTFKVTIEWSEE